MKYVKIVQSGDFHLDSPLSQHHLKFRSKRREELLYAFKNVIDFAIKESADLLLLTGDLFDSKRVTKKTLDFIILTLSSFRGRVFISPGNHDPHMDGGLYDQINFPKNTHVFKHYEEVYLKELDCVVCGVGFLQDYHHEDLLQGVKAPNGPKLKIMVMHGEVSESANPYNPISKESIYSSGFTYLALGHRHEFSGILREGETCYGYAGIPEGRGFDEQGEKGVIVGKIHDHGVNLNFKKICQRIYEEIVVELSSCITTADMVEKIKKAIKNKNSICKIKLKGSIPPYIRVNLEEIEAALFHTLEDFTLYDETMVTPEKSVFGPRSIQQHFLNMVEKKGKELGHDQELLNEVKNMGLRILSQENF